MSKVRINDLARELEVKSRAILDVLTAVGVTEKKTHSSSLELDEAERVRGALTRGGSRGSGGGSSARRNGGVEERPSIDLSKVSKPGDVLRAIQERQAAAAAPPPRPIVAAAPPHVPWGQRRRRLRYALRLQVPRRWRPRPLHCLRHQRPVPLLPLLPHHRLGSRCPRRRRLSLRPRRLLRPLPGRHQHRLPLHPSVRPSVQLPATAAPLPGVLCRNPGRRLRLSPPRP